MAAEPFPVLDVSEWPWQFDEPMGKAGKRWLRDPANNGRWLWKPVTEQHEHAATFLKGEDWAEKIASELARLLAIPAATVELASLGGRRGVVVATVAPPGTELVHGNELLEAVVPNYPREHRQETPHYRLDTIVQALGHFDVRPPSPAPPGDAMAVFVHYLALDALIANTDRHHTNWGVLRHVDDGTRTLAPSFDHATSLGFQLSDDRRRRTLDEPGGIEAFAAAGRSRPFEGKPHLDHLLTQGVRLRPDAGTHITQTLAALDEDALVRLATRVPEDVMSEPSRTFVQQLLVINRRRVLDACHNARR